MSDKLRIAKQFIAALKAGLVAVLEALVRLTGHGSLVASQVVGLNANTVDGDDITNLQVDDVTDMEEVDVELFSLTRAVWLKACHGNLNLN